nr:WAS/WASL-interacting protein family member 1 [Aegilops tauschii subsp. strangulata]XP_040257541.1 WAS/WASL-interacting protein family member 1 [Aegilops tauschii subsp. strangulata]
MDGCSPSSRPTSSIRLCSASSRVLAGPLARLSSTLRARLLVLVAEAAEQEAERPSPVPVASRPRRLVPDLAGRSITTSSLEPPLPNPRPRHADDPPVVPHPPEGAIFPRSSAAAAGLVSLPGRRAPRSLTSASSSPAPPSRFLASFSSPPPPAPPRSRAIDRETRRAKPLQSPVSFAASSSISSGRGGRCLCLDTSR